MIPAPIQHARKYGIAGRRPFNFGRFARDHAGAQTIRASGMCGTDMHVHKGHMAAGRVKPRIETCPPAKANDVRDRLEAGKVRYRAVLTL